jgi:DNA-binding NarL/FixJ family response regulator
MVLTAEVERPELLLIEDDEPFTNVLVRLYKHAFSVTGVKTHEDGLLACTDPQRFSGIIIDVILPDGSGLRTLRNLRERGVACPILVLTALFERELAASVQLFGAEYLPKPPDRDHLDAFGRRVFSFARTDHDRQKRLIETFAQAHKLTARETELLALAVSGLSRGEIAQRMGIKMATLKTNIRALLRKTRTKAFTELLSKLQNLIRGQP